MSAEPIITSYSLLGVWEPVVAGCQMHNRL